MVLAIPLCFIILGFPIIFTLVVLKVVCVIIASVKAPKRRTVQISAGDTVYTIKKLFPGFPPLNPPGGTLSFLYYNKYSQFPDFSPLNPSQYREFKIY